MSIAQHKDLKLVALFAPEHAGHERGVLTAVTELSAKAVTEMSPARLGEVESSLELALTRLFALKEAYHDLKANENFLQLQRDPSTAIQRFPGVLIAGAAGVTDSEFFSAPDDERAAVPVVLG